MEGKTSPYDDEFSDKSEMSFLDHLEVLRWHLVRSSIAIMLFMAIAFVFKGFVFDQIILAPQSSEFLTYRLFCDLSHWLDLGNKLCFDDISFSLINIAMSGQFTTHILVSAIAGFILAFPYLLIEVWRFISPGLKKSEKKSAFALVFWGTILFMSGVLFGYYVIAPLSVQFLGNYTVSSTVSNSISLNSYISTLTSIIIACAIVFQLPIIVYFLSKIGLITPQLMKTYRRHSIVIVLILSAIITPPDITSQILVAIPLVFLYEVSILISRMVIRKNSN
ncbi:twin-arginine translocase subunit TatC [Vicingaceae bacterium]|jgi:sec-independent protein translocase protein TatC|nr:twin-arginine translocase subunit TatC [Vicingaceae bacterium]